MVMTEQDIVNEEQRMCLKQMAAICLMSHSVSSEKT